MPIANRVKVINRRRYQGSANEALLKAADDYIDRQISDPFDNKYGSAVSSGDYVILQPQFPLAQLMKVPQQNNTLSQCIEAMITNIEGTGHILEYIGEPGGEEGEDVLAEKQRLDSLLDMPNSDESLNDIRRKWRADYETLGFACLEVGRNDATGEILWFAHVPANTMRKTKKDAKPVPIKVWLKRNGKWVAVDTEKRFRRYVQIGANGRRVYFKDFGDPRQIATGNGSPLNDNIKAIGATEIIWTERYVPGEVYGLPRYINNIPALLGSREAELVNLGFFSDNAIPALAILVSGGALTTETCDELEQKLGRRGREMMNKVVIIEAKAADDQNSVEGDNRAPMLHMQPLGGDRQGDGLFQEYDKNNATKVRSSFRLPPITVGLSEDYSRATADSSMDVAESQVFQPERATTDQIYNDKILSLDGKPPVFWKFKSNPIRLANKDALIEAVTQFDAVGAMTPNVAIDIFNSVFGTKVPKVKEDWGNIPFATSQLQQQAQADAQNLKIDGDTHSVKVTKKTPTQIAAGKAKKSGGDVKQKQQAIQQPAQSQKGSAQSKVQPKLKKSEGFSYRYRPPVVQPVASFTRTRRVTVPVEFTRSRQ